MIGFGMSLGRADRLGQPRLSEGAQPYLVAELWHDFHNPGPDPNLITRTWRQKPVTRDPKCFQPLTANR
jgi:hypothetical protein